MFELICVAHWLGDFKFQHHNMATRKSSSLWWLTLHILTYSTTLWVLLLSVYIHDPNKVAAYVAINGLLHFIIDFFTSKVTSHYHGKVGQENLYYSAIGFDQALHTMCLYRSAVIMDMI
jgi:hypothetical protein